MIALDLDAPDVARTARWITQTHESLLDAEVQMLQLAAHWADLHHPDSRPAPLVAGGERAVQWGGEGTPEVCEFAAAEFGTRQQSSVQAGRAWIADALDLRHRLPRCWAKTMAGGAPVWQARQIARATRHLSVEAAGRVDAGVAPALGLVGWGRLQNLLAGRIIAADPEAADQQAQLWEAEQFVRASSTRENGLKLVVAKALAGDVAVFMATLNRITDILRLRGDRRDVDVVRAHALGVLGQPAEAMRLLWEHRHDHHPVAPPPEPDEPVENRSDAEHSRADHADGDVAGEPDERDQGTDGSGLHLGPPPVDARSLRPKVVLYVHVSAEALTAGEGVARMEDVGPVTLAHVRRFLNGPVDLTNTVDAPDPNGPTGRRRPYDIRIQPVIDLNDAPAPVDAYEIPDRIAEHVRLTAPASTFPFSPTANRRTDLDHAPAYVPVARGGPPGQTAVDRLSPLTRHEHRIKTHGRWQRRQPAIGLSLWRAPTGEVYLTTAAGCQNLGDNGYTQTLWRAAEDRWPLRRPPIRPDVEEPEYAEAGTVSAA